MRRSELEHVLRAACEIAGAQEALVIGSQAILGSFSEEVLPPEAISSIEVDLAFFDDPDDERSNLVDGSIGELSQFHETYGYFAQGVSVSTAVLPSGWRERLTTFQTPGMAPARGLCLEPHDLVVSKLVAFRDKDRAFAEALVRVGLVHGGVLRERIALLDVRSHVRDRLLEWVNAIR